jgi:hypothetical protein
MKQSQSSRILKYLQSGRSLTVLEALRLFGCYALSQRIGELRRQGWPIDATWKRTRHAKRIKRYSMPVRT